MMAAHTAEKSDDNTYTLGKGGGDRPRLLGLHRLRVLGLRTLHDYLGNLAHCFDGIWMVYVVVVKVSSRKSFFMAPTRP